MHSAVIAWELFQKANTEIYEFAPLRLLTSLPFLETEKFIDVFLNSTNFPRNKLTSVTRIVHC